MQTVNPKNALHTLTFLFTQLLALSTFAIDPPDSVEKNFKEKFPQAEGNKWLHTGEKHREYVAEFTLSKDKVKAYFDAKGNFVETEKEIDSDKLPVLVKQALETQFQHFKIIKSYEIVKSDNKHAYELTIKSDGVKTTLIMSQDGYMIAR